MKLGDTLLIFKKTNGHCFYCGAPAEAIDHFLPRAILKGIEEIIDGENVENLFLVCNRCNQRKSAKFPEDFLDHAWRRYYRANKRVGLSKESDFNPIVYGQI